MSKLLFANALVIVGIAAFAEAAGKELPRGLSWETTSGDLPLIADLAAQAGGEAKVRIASFPLTLRTVGPGANSSMYAAILANNWSLTATHPNTRQPIGLLASEWAYGTDGRTVFYRIDPRAKWSDGKPVTSADFTYTLEFMRSPEIQDPWYNRYYTDEIADVTVYDERTFAVVLRRKRPDLILHTNLQPTPRHFYGKLKPDFVKTYDWKVVPNTGPYVIDPAKIVKGAKIVFVRNKTWWAKEKKFFRGRFNVDKITFVVIRSDDEAWNEFTKGNIETFNLGDPLYWYDKSDIDLFKNGYIHKLWFYTRRPQGCFGLWLNAEQPFFSDVNVRRAVAHSVNFDKVIKGFMRGEAKRLNGCTEGYGPYTNTHVKALEFDLKKSAELFAQAGWSTKDGLGVRIKEGLRMEFNVLYTSDSQTPKLRLLAEDLARAGIKMNLDKQDEKTIRGRIARHEQEAVYLGFAARNDGIPDYRGVWHGRVASHENSNNVSNINDKELNDLIDKFDKSQKSDDRIKLAHDIQKRQEEVAVLIPGYVTPFFRMAYWRWWRLPKPPATIMSGSGFEFFDSASGGLMWFDPQLKADTLKAMASGRKFSPVVLIDRTYEGREGN
jgi:microcin C transport system substrate-binding protein